MRVGCEVGRQLVLTRLLRLVCAENPGWKDEAYCEHREQHSCIVGMFGSLLRMVETFRSVAEVGGCWQPQNSESGSGIKNRLTGSHSLTRMISRLDPEAWGVEHSRGKRVLSN